eukprot:11286262-Alexandrium_andersonii.AAC.1
MRGAKLRNSQWVMRHPWFEGSRRSLRRTSGAAPHTDSGSGWADTSYGPKPLTTEARFTRFNPISA